MGRPIGGRQASGLGPFARPLAPKDHYSKSRVSGGDWDHDPEGTLRSYAASAGRPPASLSQGHPDSDEQGRPSKRIVLDVEIASKMEGSSATNARKDAPGQSDPVEELF